MRFVLANHHIIRLIVNASVRQDVRVIITTCVNIVRQLTLYMSVWLAPSSGPVRSWYPGFDNIETLPTMQRAHVSIAKTSTWRWGTADTQTPRAAAVCCYKLPKLLMRWCCMLLVAGEGISGHTISGHAVSLPRKSIRALWTQHRQKSLSPSNLNSAAAEMTHLHPNWSNKHEWHNDTWDPHKWLFCC